MNGEIYFTVEVVDDKSHSVLSTWEETIYGDDIGKDLRLKISHKLSPNSYVSDIEIKGTKSYIRDTASMESAGLLKGDVVVAHVMADDDFYDDHPSSLHSSITVSICLLDDLPAKHGALQEFATDFEYDETISDVVTYIGFKRDHRTKGTIEGVFVFSHKGDIALREWDDQPLLSPNDEIGKVLFHKCILVAFFDPTGSRVDKDLAFYLEEGEQKKPKQQRSYHDTSLASPSRDYDGDYTTRSHNKHNNYSENGREDRDLRERRERVKRRLEKNKREEEWGRRGSYSPRRSSRSPRRRSPSPRRRSRSPIRRSPSPRRRSPSPRGRSRSPRGRSSRHRSPSPSPPHSSSRHYSNRSPPKSDSSKTRHRSRSPLLRRSPPPHKETSPSQNPYDRPARRPSVPRHNRPLTPAEKAEQVEREYLERKKQKEEDEKREKEDYEREVAKIRKIKQAEKERRKEREMAEKKIQQIRDQEIKERKQRIENRKKREQVLRGEAEPPPQSIVETKKVDIRRQLEKLCHFVNNLNTNTSQPNSTQYTTANFCT